MRIQLLTPCVGVAVALLMGCTTSPYCDDLRTCGGNFLANQQDLGAGVPAQEWVATASGACVDQVPNPPQSPSMAYVPPRPAGVRAVEPSTVDWCAGLRLSSDGNVQAFDDGWYETLKKFNGWFPSIPVFTAQLEIAQNNQYTFTTTQLAAQQFDLSSTCLSAQGVVLQCSDLAPRLKSFVEKRLGGIMGLTPTVYGEHCDKTDEGCACSYNVQLVSTSSGPWAAESGVISFYDAQAMPPAPADYCVSEKTLELTGDQAGDLFNRTSLKTLELQAPSCNDGVQSKTLGETGIDCGGSCPTACPQ